MRKIRRLFLWPIMIFLALYLYNGYLHREERGYGFHYSPEEDYTSELEMVQKKLSNLSYYDGEIDSSMGPETKEAIKKFEGIYDLEISENINAKTFNRLMECPNNPPIDGLVYIDKIPKRGDKSEDVERIRRRLRERGYDIRVGKKFDRDLEKTLRKFQAENEIPPTGKADLFTIFKLFSQDINYMGEGESTLIDVPYMSQISPFYAPAGCEGTSLLMALKSKGHAKNLSLEEFLENMPKHESNPAKGYVGDYTRPEREKRTTIYPEKLAEYGCSYGAEVKNISGSSLEEIASFIKEGKPVVVYVTLFWEEAVYKEYLIEGKYENLLKNNHVILLDGFDPKTGAFHLSDPYNHEQMAAEKDKDFKYWVSYQLLNSRYSLRKQAVLIEK